MPDPQGPRPVLDEVEAVARTVEAALAADPSPVTRIVRHLVRRDLRRATSLQQASVALGARVDQLARVQDELREGQAHLVRLRDARLLTEPFGHEWQERVRMDLAGADPEEGADLWVRRYAEAFVASSFSTCLWLCDTEELRPSRPLVPVLRASAEAARRGARAYALPGLERLTGPECEPALRSSPDVLARCWCMRARVVCRDLSDPGPAAELLVPVVQASALWPPGARAALHVVLGECRLAQGDTDRARDHVRAAAREGGAELSALVLRGLLAEATGNAPRAQQAYDRALEVDAELAVTGPLFAPVPPVLLWRYARRLRADDPEGAVAALRRALAEDVVAPGLPQHKAYVDLARALERLDRRDDAAAAYWHAGRRYADAGDHLTATTFLQRASELAPERHQYRSTLAQALCREAVREDGLVDLGLLEQSRRDWQAAMQLAGVEPASCDDYLTGASLAHLSSGDVYRPRPSYLAVLVLERGLLVHPGDARTLARLSQAHRLVGHPWTARRLAERPPGDADDALTDQLLLALLELDRAEEALAVLDRRGDDASRPWLANRRAQALLHLGRSAEALELLQRRAVADDCLHWLQLGLCQWLQGMHREARESHQRARDADGSAGRSREYLVAWADYLLGSYDDAARVLERVLRRDPLDPALLREHAQVLLARGAPGDLARGAAQLREGVTTSRSSYALATLTRLDLPRLLAATRDRPHAVQVAAAVEEVSQLAEDVRRRLASAPDEQAELTRSLTLADGTLDGDGEDDRTRACRAALARLSEERHDALTAARAYAALTDEHAVPEARLGTERSVRRAWQQLDRIARDGDAGDRHDGLRLCEQIAAVVDGTTGGAQGLAAGTHLRAALLAAQDEDVETVAAQAAAARSAAGPAAVREVLEQLVDRPSDYWCLRAASSRVLGSRTSTGPERDAAAALQEALHLAGPLRSRASDVDGSRLFPLVVPLALRLGPALLPPAAPDAEALWRELLAGLWDRVLDETGVPLPGISIEALPDQGATSWTVELYGQQRACGDAGPTVPVDDADGRRAAAREVVAAVDQVVRASLSRLFSLDDAALWLSGATARPSAATAPGFGPTDSLEVQRLLRLLLREHVPVLDHQSILEEIRAAGPGWSAPHLLPRVRLRLSRAAQPTHLGQGSGPLLPADLEAALRAGLDARDTSLWELPRTEAARLVEGLLAWHAEAGNPSSIRVRDPALRTALWRLLAVSVPGQVRVLTEEECGGR